MVRIDGKWGALASAVPLELVCGLQYSFAVYSEALKERHGLSEAQIAFIGAMVVFGNSVLGVLAGAAFDRLSARLKSGPRICCLVSLALALCTYPPLWAIASGSWTPAGGPNVATAFLSAFACLSALCGSVCDVVAMGVSVTNFPQHRGQVVGQLKAFVGLSSSFHLVLYAAIPRGDSSNYILLQLASAVVATSLGAVLQSAEPSQGYEAALDSKASDAKLRAVFGCVVAMAGYVAAANLLPRAVKTEHTSIAAAALLLLGFFLMMVWVAQKPVAHGKHCVSSATADPGGEMTVPLLTDAPVNKTEEGAIPHRSSLYGSILSCTSLIGHGTSSTPSRACSIAVGSTDAITAEPQGEHGVLSTKTLSEAVLTSDYWLLFCVLLFAAGSGMTFINNLGQVVASTEGAVGSQNVFVAMYSVSSCIARGLVGQVSQQLLVCRGIPRPVFLALGSATMAASCFCSSAGSVRLLYVGTVLGGFAFGSFTTLMSVLTSEFFGSRSFATIYSTMIAAVAAGSVILSAGLVSYLYDAASRRHKDPGNTCRGPDCFRDSLLVMGVLSLVATLFSLALASKTRRQYLFVQAWIRETSTMGTLTVDGTE